MNINRHNYEEYFLLLADGELSPAETEAVLSFTQLHPDLAEELDLLMGCRLDAEIPPIFPKEKLLKPVLWNVDAPEDIQLQLLALLDHELGAEAQVALENKIAASPLLQQEWQFLQTHTKVEAAMSPAFPTEKILKPTIWNIEEPDTVYVQMMSLLDGELSATDQQELEQKIAANKALAIEWQSLQQTRLQAEAVVFPHKEKLYRQKETRKIAGWMQWAAAAAVLFGIVAAFWPKANTPNSTLAVNTTQTAPNNSAQTTIPAPTSTTTPQQNNTAVAATNELNLNANSTAGTTATTTQRSDAALVPLAIIKNSDNKNDKHTANLVTANAAKNTATTDYNNSTANTYTTLAANNDQETMPEITRNRKTITGSTATLDAMEAPRPRQLNAITANMQPNNTTIFRTTALTNGSGAIDNTNSDDEMVYIAGARINKQKVRGVFRGITRSLGRTFTKSKVEADNDAPLQGRTP